MSEYVFRDAPGFGFDMDDQMEALPMTAREYYASNCSDHYGTLHEEIVRCRDCKFYDEDDGYGNYGCTLLDFGTKDMADGFCSWAERREQ